MIRELGNVEFFRVVRNNTESAMFSMSSLLESCGQFLFESESRRKFSKLRLGALSVPHYVIKKRLCHGARHGKTEEQKEYQRAWKARKRCCKRVDSQGEHVTCIHDRILRDQVYRESQLLIWLERATVHRDGRIDKARSHVQSL